MPTNWTIQRDAPRRAWVTLADGHYSGQQPTRAKAEAYVVEAQRHEAEQLAWRIAHGREPGAIGFDYLNQAWMQVDATRTARYLSCAHEDAKQCQCFGKLHEGEEPDAEIVRDTEWSLE